MKLRRITHNMHLERLLRWKGPLERILPHLTLTLTLTLTRTQSPNSSTFGELHTIAQDHCQAQPATVRVETAAEQPRPQLLT